MIGKGRIVPGNVILETRSDEIIRSAYSALEQRFWIGYGKPSDTDQTPIEIKRVTTDPETGDAMEQYATGPWEDYLTLIYT